jgi:glycosyltransferase involved in cell wall biosynthesis
MKIAYLIPGCGVSGGLAVICQHVNRLMARGHEVLMVSESFERKIDWFPNQNVCVIGLCDLPHDLDILVATAWSTSYSLALLPAKHKCYFVQSDESRFHPQGSLYEHITRLSYMFNYNFVTEAKWIKKWLKSNFNQDSELVPNGLDEKIFYPSSPLQPKGKKVRVLLEGAINLPFKGMAEAFKAVENLDVEVWCVSSFGKPHPSWKCDKFFEKVPMTEMRRIYSSCDILLKLSRVEGFFGPPLEMMACGGLVVVGKVSGYDEYIKHEFNALVVDPLKPKDAAIAITRLINDKALRNHLLKNGNLTAQKWRWEKSIDALENYFKEIVSRSRGIKSNEEKDSLTKSISYFYRQLIGANLVHKFKDSKTQNYYDFNRADELSFKFQNRKNLNKNIATARFLNWLERKRWFHLLALFSFKVHKILSRFK